MNRQDAKTPRKTNRNFLESWRLGGSIFFVLIFCAAVSATEVIPPAPANHFNDYANVVSPSTANRLNKELEDFERQTSNQILVAIYPKMQTDSSIEDYTIRIAEKWKPGLKSKNNGAILFVFIADRKMRIETGYGLEGALPDATCEQIIDQEIKPHFKNGDYDGGLTAGVSAMMAATRGEYKGNGKTVKDSSSSSGHVPIWLIFIAIIIIFNVISSIRRATVYGRSGRRGGWFWGPLLWGMTSGGSWGGGGGSFGGGGGTFSGGGGSFGGGGASGSW